MPREPSKTAFLKVRAGIGGEPIVVTMEASKAAAFEPNRWGAWLIGDPDHPVGGDDLYVRFEVGVGCCTEIRSKAPVIARPGVAAGVPSWVSTNVSVARDAMLAWCPEPGVAASQADHTHNVNVRLGANSRLLWVDDFELGHHKGEAPGTWRSRIRVTREGWPAVTSELAIGPGSDLWHSPAVLGGAPAVSLVVVVDPDHPRQTWACDRAISADRSVRGVSLPLSGPGAQFIVWGSDLVGCRELLAQMLEPAGVPAWIVQRLRLAERGSLRGVGA